MHKEMDSSNERKCQKTKEPLIQKKNGGTEKEKVKTRRRKLQPRNRSPNVLPNIDLAIVV
jgi:hypothetical protein